MDLPVPHDDALPGPSAEEFYRNKIIIVVEWWLENCVFPDIHWACLRVFSDGTADVTFGEGGTHYGFKSQEYAGYFLSEDEYSRFADFDLDDERDYGIPFRTLTPPQWIDDIHQQFCYIGEY